MTSWTPGPPPPPPTSEIRKRLRNGGEFLLDAPAATPWVWGQDQRGFWAQGEPLLVCAPNGAGKTTLGAQIAECRAGLGPADLLGFPLPADPEERPVLYLAMDRPSQARRALLRVFGGHPRADLERTLVFWPGPPLHDLARHDYELAEMVEESKAGTLVVDSNKDAALGLSDEEVGGGWNRARQRVIELGVEVLELHHPVKSHNDPPVLGDVYGSAWITAGCGSVLFLAGAAGDPVVRLHHLKPNAEPEDPFDVEHDAATGRSSKVAGPSLLALGGSSGGVTARAAAEHAWPSPTKSQVERMRRKLDRLVRDGVMYIDTAGSTGGSAGGTATVYRTVPVPT